ALERIAPLRLAADWDAVGLLVAPRGGDVRRIVVCLTLTPEVAAEAARERADLVVTHHPLPFRPIGRITPETGTGRVLLELVAAGCGVWSSHTAWDSAAGGINDQLASLLSLDAVVPIVPDPIDPSVGFGRLGRSAVGQTPAALGRLLADRLGARGVQLVADDDQREAGRVGVVCGSGGDLVGRVADEGCRTLVTGEIKLHQAIEARAAGLAVVAVGHHASEYFSMVELSRRLVAETPGLEARVAASDRDPITWP
ncbi:MAG: Nif3-like dinuclear metal center hexameric protein, partial [Planctomycetes bacterium]|nr:Nif3-like dinuclear metal center hexameric protein [Planctomycetota bacterium]